LLIKPRLGTTELPDLVRYKAKSASFPQQPTSDQTFDEPQWESYFRLGQIISDTIFEKARRATGETEAEQSRDLSVARPKRWWPRIFKPAEQTAEPGPPAVSPDALATRWWPSSLARLPDPVPQPSPAPNVGPLVR
jgi:hypothetical protein